MIVAIATVKRLFTIFAGVNISKGILFFKIYTSLILSFKFNWNNLKDNNFVLFYEEKWQKPTSLLKYFKDKFNLKPFLLSNQSIGLLGIHHFSKNGRK